ncbi:NUDIX hydrolase N-terminal domain-containing protein [Candidatus Stoquefichus massiliensis]|uniref:NUDIX hydrolase N-terminal domain-containing protein n=1 Tax=Candidatus Stoquefichus massiliensis TaxID=1470350 RepID=UPI0004802E4F|nr:NUDIX hydrolase [Candidatus Stoquefichus massiliensis]
MANNQLLDDIIEMQSLAQAGLYYGHDKFDLERYERIRELAADMLAICLEMPVSKIKDVFCHEEGYQTPKLDTRAAIFNEMGEILLVQENDGLWSLPGGWVDMNTSIKENTEKEVKEEAGLDVKAIKIIAIMDRDKHNLPRYLYKVIKVFVMCEVISGHFEENIETIQCQYFAAQQLPELSTAKNNKKQIEMCFESYHHQNWQTYFD